MDKNELFDLTLKGISTQELVNYISKKFRNPVVLISKNFKIISYSDPKQVKDKTWLQAVERGFITLEFGFNLANWKKFEKTNQEYLEFKEINNNTRRFYKLNFQNNLLGYLNFLEVDTKLDQFNDEDYELAVKVLSKEVYITTSDIHNTNKYTNEDILFSLHNQDFRSEIHFKQRVDSLQLNNYSKYQLIIADIKDYISYNANTDNLKNEINNLFNNCVVITELNLLYILLCNHEFILNREVMYFLNKKNLTFNLSSPFTKLYDYKIYENEALDALDLKKYLDQEKKVTSYNDVKIFKMLTSYEFQGGYQKYLDNTITAIIEYDEIHKSELLKTLYNYLKYEKSVKIVASKLFIHRNTVNYRVKQLRELFNIDFDDFYTLVKLYLSIQLYIINEKKLA